MVEDFEVPGRGLDPRERIERARSAIDRSYEELTARAEQGRERAFPPRSDAPAPERRDEPRFGDLPPDRRFAETVAAIEERVSELVGGRMRAAERRLELQAEALEAGLDAEAERLVGIAEKRLGEAVAEEVGRAEGRLRAEGAEGLEQSERRLGERAADGLAEARRALEEVARTTASRSVEEGLAEAEDRLRTLVDARLAGATQSQQEAAVRIEGEIRDRLEEGARRVGGELEARVETAAERAVASRMEVARAGFQADVARLQGELEEVRKELSRRSIRRERKRLEQSAEERLTGLDRVLGERRAELTEDLSRGAAAHSERIAAELEAGLAAARAELAQANAALRGELAEAAGQRGEEAVSAALERRTGDLELRLAEMADRLNETSERRIAGAAEAAEARIASAERAQKREESIRRRTEKARAEAESRVRAAEQRLVEVLSELKGS